MEWQQGLFDGMHWARLEWLKQLVMDVQPGAKQRRVIGVACVGRHGDV